MALFATLANSNVSNLDNEKEDDENNSNSNNDSGSTNLRSSKPPTAIQLYDDCLMDFITGSILRGESNASSGRRPFEVLSYQAVEAGSVGSAAAAVGGGAAADSNRRPNLGVWDVRLSSVVSDVKLGPSNALVDRLLEGVVTLVPKAPTDKKKPGENDGEEKKESSDEKPNVDAASTMPPTFVFVVDLSNPVTISSAIKAMTDAILRRFDSEDAAELSLSPVFSAKSSTTTTPIESLRLSQFGIAPDHLDEEKRRKVFKRSSSSMRSPKASLVICCLVPPRPSSSSTIPDDAQPTPLTFKDKQAQNLVLYHLHRWAAELDCTLCFVRADADDGEAPDPNASPQDASSDLAPLPGALAHPSISVSELAETLTKVAQGQRPVEGDTAPVTTKTEQGSKETTEQPKTGENANETKEDAKKEETPTPDLQPAIYAPGSYDDDIIDSVLLRNASCPGVWDASKDDLSKALADYLPPTTTVVVSKKDATPPLGGIRGDDAWLGRLQHSVAGILGDAAPTQTDDSDPEPKRKPKSGKKKASRSNAAGRPKDDQAVANFFEDLLKS